MRVSFSSPFSRFASFFFLSLVRIRCLFVAKRADDPSCSRAHFITWLVAVLLPVGEIEYVWSGCGGLHSAVSNAFPVKRRDEKQSNSAAAAEAAEKSDFVEKNGFHSSHSLCPSLLRSFILDELANKYRNESAREWSDDDGA